MSDLIMVDRIDRLNMIIQNQLSTMNAGYVRAVCSTEVLQENYETGYSTEVMTWNKNNGSQEI